MFANIRNGEIIDFNCNYLDEDIIKVETSENIYNAWQEDRAKVIYQDSEIILNPDYEERKRQEEKEVKRQEILDELDKLDLKSIRAIRANDEEYIAQYEAQAQELRKQLQEL